MMVQLDELPLLVMMKVFEDLSDPRDVDSVSRVCRLFNELITNHSNTLAKFAFASLVYISLHSIERKQYVQD